MSTQIANAYDTNVMEAATGLLSSLVALTTKQFGSDVSISESFDPEFPQDKFIVLCVKPKMEPEEIVRAEGEWAREVARIAPHWDKLRLLILPQ